ncbi:hypothetical protein ECH_0817 [Ehrlichia chaffeensis str. Arkansas]|uniref:Uncharacterized protein n=1 Tax=Ehrlichia chaffeensis (strain ATCC CRL-10679 / Arkansas) TaxID=205920 RepID=Q2GG20_EHRCR|nr:hypothetical protein ECH_0817 [Ehrlichia chaffeensis str. Arkansas]
MHTEKSLQLLELTNNLSIQHNTKFIKYLRAGNK